MQIHKMCADGTEVRILEQLPGGRMSIYVSHKGTGFISSANMDELKKIIAAHSVAPKELALSPELAELGFAIADNKEQG